MRHLKVFYIVLALPLFFSFSAAHKYYVSVTHVNYSEKDRAIQITTRLFIDDFDRLLMARYDLDAQLATEKESPSADAYIEKYLRSKFVVALDGEAVAYDFIGKRYDNDVMVCYIEIPEIDLNTVKTIEIENEMLTDLFEEQQNLVHINLKNKKKSFVLIKSRAKGMLNL